MTKTYFKHTITQNAIADLEQVMLDQDHKGIEKYNTALDPNLDYNWGTMADEEIADFIKYRQCQKISLQNAIKLLESQQRQQHSDYVELALSELKKCL